MTAEQPDIRARLADFLYEAGIPPGDVDDRVSDLLSLPGIAIVDTANVDPIAAAIAANWPDTYAKSWPWTDIPEADRDAYRERARTALLQAAAGESDEDRP